MENCFIHFIWKLALSLHPENQFDQISFLDCNSMSLSSPFSVLIPSQCVCRCYYGNYRCSKVQDCNLTFMRYSFCFCANHVSLNLFSWISILTFAIWQLIICSLFYAMFGQLELYHWRWLVCVNSFLGMLPKWCIAPGKWRMCGSYTLLVECHTRTAVIL